MSKVESNLGKLLFSFVVVSDTHVNERDGQSTSPFKTNHRANTRARHVFREIASLEPAPRFVVHLGDMVHPVPSQPTYRDAAAKFREISSPIVVPIHVVPGNHDIGDKCLEWMPAGQIDAQSLATYREAFGPDHYAFDHAGIKFVCLNALLLNSGLPEEPLQRRWLEHELRRGGDTRTFLFLHYPPFVHAPDEPGTYDNIDEPARSWLVSLIARSSIEAVFSGHVHNFWYHRIGNAECYLLPSTAFLRHDYTEFYSVSPGEEYGRGNVEKFGYYVIDLYERGHLAHQIRTMGREGERGESPPKAWRPQFAHPKISRLDNLGVELRHPWANVVEITSTGGVQEFGRKKVRNDYPLLALFEMGVRLLKVPESDVLDRAVGDRMKLLSRVGHRYVVTCVGMPSPELAAAPLKDQGVRAIEVNLTLKALRQQEDELRELRQRTGLELFISKIQSDEDDHFDGTHFNHFINAGFTLGDLERLRGQFMGWARGKLVDGVSVRIETNESLSLVARELEAFACEAGLKVIASLKTTGPNLVTEGIDDRSLVAKVTQAAILSRASPLVSYIFDNFMDVDRGYFPRRGFIDRRFDPRPAARAYATLNCLLSNAENVSINSSEPAVEHTIAFEIGTRRFIALTCPSAAAVAQLTREDQTSSVHDLVSGAELTVAEQIVVLSDGREEIQTLLIERS